MVTDLTYHYIVGDPTPVASIKSKASMFLELPLELKKKFTLNTLMNNNRGMGILQNFDVLQLD